MNITKSIISIIGCGWLGLPLGKSLVDLGFRVYGSTTTESKINILKKKMIEPFLLNFSPNGSNIAESFFDSEILIINIPPHIRTDIPGYYLNQIKEIVKFTNAGNISKVIFISSTSVYGEVNRDVYEQDEAVPETDSGIALLNVERFLKDETGFALTIIRFGGLIGRDRNPVKYFSGRRDLPNGKAPVNLIHLDDCIGIIKRVIELETWSEVFNACADIHPEKQTYYTNAAKKLNYDIPVFRDELLTFKIIRSNKCKNQLNYTFKYPDPLEFPID